MPAQKITGVYTSTDKDYFTKSETSGPIVVLELSTDYIVPVNIRKDPAPGPRPPSAGAGPANPGAQPAPPAPAPHPELPPNPESMTKVGNISWDPAAHPASLLPAGHGGNGKVISVTQVGTIAAVDGTSITAGSSARENNLVRNFVVDGFMKPDYRDASYGNLKYNIHFPRDYNQAKKYPLVMYLADQNDSGSTHADALMLANGGVIWAERDEEARNEAIVAVPLAMHTLVNEKYEAVQSTRPGPPPGKAAPSGATSGQGNPAPAISNSYLSTVNFIDYLSANIPNIGKDRIYLTGQGDGARAAIKLMIDQPNTFAAALLFAPDYDPAHMSPLSNANLWIVVSQADEAVYSNMESCMASLKALGAHVGKSEWNGNADAKQLASDVSNMVKGGNNIKFSVLKKGTTLPPGVEDNALDNHAYTWRIGYSIQSLRDWLFTQKK